MQASTKQFRISRTDKRSQTTGKNFLYPVIDVKPFNPWLSSYIKDYKTSIRKNTSLGPKMMKTAKGKTPNPKPQSLTASQSHQNLPSLIKSSNEPREEPNKLKFEPQDNYQKSAKVNFKPNTKQEDDDREFELKPNMSEVFPNNRSAKDRKLNCILSDNTEYFAHIMGKCICGLCTCGQCRCNHPREINLGLKNVNDQSLYQRDYVKHNIPGKKQLRKQKTEQMVFKEPFSNNTLYRTDYISMDPNKVIEPQRLHQLERPGYDDCLGKLRAPFPKNSLYDETYLNWQNSVPVVRFNDKEEYNKVKVPFTGKPSNKDYGNFKPEDITDQVDNTMFGKQQFKNPLGPHGQFRGESTTHNAYKKIGAIDRPRNYKENQNKENNINSEGHFTSTYKDYAGTKPPKCPAKEIITNARQQMIEQSMKKYSDLVKKLA